MEKIIRDDLMLRAKAALDVVGINGKWKISDMRKRYHELRNDKTKTAINDSALNSNAE